MQDTIETINEATLCYVLAANLLGPKPQALPEQGASTSMNFLQLKQAGLDPLALLTLRLTGSCSVTVPEWLFDRDCPGHYMRRIKIVSLSIPSVVGSFTSINCTLSLQSSNLRVSPSLNGGVYARDTTQDDARFVDYFGGAESIVAEERTIVACSTRIWNKAGSCGSREQGR